jgi:hypothetical protein
LPRSRAAGSAPRKKPTSRLVREMRLGRARRAGRPRGCAEATDEREKGNGKKGKGTKGRGTKGKSKGKKGKDDEDDDGPKWLHCSSRGWRVTAKFFFWFAVCTFFFVSAFGLFVKVATAVQTLGGQIGVGTRLLLNILDLAYVAVSLVAMVPKMVRPEAPPRGFFSRMGENEIVVELLLYTSFFL